MKHAHTLATLPTLNATMQRGAQLHIALIGTPEAVQRDAYLLANYGLATLPDDYRDGQDDTVTLVSNLYRLRKYARACALASIASGGRRARIRMRTAVSLRETKYYNATRELLRAKYEPLASSPVREYGIGAHGRAGMGSEE